MLLEKISKYYWFLGSILLIGMFPYALSVENMIYIYWFNVFAFLLFGLVLQVTMHQKESYYNVFTLFTLVFVVSLVEMLGMKLVSFAIDEDYMVFSKADSMVYLKTSTRMADMSWSDAIKYIGRWTNYGIDDMGGSIYMSTIFRISKSLFFLGFAHVLIGSIMSLYLYIIGNFFMSRKYSFLASLTLSIASFTVCMESVVLKEPMFTLLVVASSYYLLLYIKEKKLSSLVFGIILSSLILFFRTPSAFIFWLAFGMAWVLKFSQSLVLRILLFLLLAIVLLSTNKYEQIYERYLRGGDINVMIERKKELAGEGGVVNHAVDPLSAFFGPFPGVVSNRIKHTPLYAIGLLYRILLAVPFMLACLLIFRKKKTEMYSLVFLFLINAIGIALAVKGAELRLSVPNLWAVYIVSFWWIEKNERKLFNKQFLKYGLLTVSGLCILWNLRLFL